MQNEMKIIFSEKLRRNKTTRWMKVTTTKLNIKIVQD